MHAETAAVALYRLAAEDPDWTVDAAAARLGLPRADLPIALSRLVELGLLTPAAHAPSGYHAVDASAALARLVEAEDERFRSYQSERMIRVTALQALLADFLHDSSARRNELHIETLRSPAQIDAALNELAVRSHREIVVMHPAPLPPTHLLRDSLRRHRGAAEAGVRVRAVFAHRPALSVDEALRELAAAGAQIRVATRLPLRMFVYDDLGAVLPVDPDYPGAGVVVIRGGAVISSLRAFFRNCWLGATPLGTTPLAAAHAAAAVAFELTDQQRAILQMMAAGIKDEVIARRLDISQRTLSRVVAAVMARLGVASRFEAGVRLAALGVLAPAG